MNLTIKITPEMRVRLAHSEQIVIALPPEVELALKGQEQLLKSLGASDVPADYEAVRQERDHLSESLDKEKVLTSALSKDLKRLTDEMAVHEKSTAQLFWLNNYLSQNGIGELGQEAVEAAREFIEANAVKMGELVNLVHQLVHGDKAEPISSNGQVVGYAANYDWLDKVGAVFGVYHKTIVNNVKAAAVESLKPLDFAAIAFRHSDSWPEDIEISDIEVAFKFMAEGIRKGEGGAA